MTKSRGGRQSKRNGTNLWENEEMVGKICWVLRVDVNLSSGPPPHCCPFTLCVYIRDFPQIHCGYNKNFYVPGQELFLFLVTSFALSNWTISYFSLKVKGKPGNLETTFWPFLQMLHLQLSFFEEIKGGHYCSICWYLPSMSTMYVHKVHQLHHAQNVHSWNSSKWRKPKQVHYIYVIVLGVRDHISIWPIHPSFACYVHYVHHDHDVQLSIVASILIGAGMLWGCVTVVPSGQDLLHCFGSPDHCPAEPPSAEPH